MRDARSVLDNVRAKIPGDAKVLVAYIGANGELRCAQANCSQADVSLIADSIKANIMADKVGWRG